MTFRPLIVTGWVVFLMPQALAEPSVLTTPLLKQTFSGARLDLDTPLGTTIPIRFTKDGLMSGDAGSTLGPVLGSTRDRGRWHVADDKLCLKFFRWFDAKERCLDVRLDGTRLFWREPGGENGTATLVETAPVVVADAPKQVVVADAPKQVVADAPKQVVVADNPKPVAPAQPQVQQPVAVASPQAPQQIVASAQETVAVPVPTAHVPPLLPFASATQAAVNAVPPPPPKPVALEQPAEPKIETTSIVPAATPAVAEQPKPAPVQTASKSPDSPKKPMLAKAVRASLGAASVPPPRRFRVLRVAANDVLNVRRGPSEYDVPVGNIPPDGRGIEITGDCRNYWCPIRFARTTGWVNGLYLAEEMGRPGRR